MISGGKRPRLADVAREAGVSIKTASRVINGVTTVDPGMRQRVLDAANRLHYRPHRGAATMRSGTSDMVGMIIRDMSNPFYSGLAAGAADEAAIHNCLLITASSEGSPEKEARLTDAIFSQRPRGLLITPSAEPAPQLITEQEMGCPITALDEPVKGLETDTVTFDNRGAAEEATETALALGRQRFGFISDAASLGTMRWRVDGMMSAIRRQGLEVPAHRQRWDVHTEAEARTAAAEILSDDTPPDALFCCNNVAAVGAALEIHARGLDVALVGFDEFSLSRTLSHPVIVVEHDAQAMGRAAARLLFQRMQDPSLPIQHVIAPTHLRRH